MADELVERIVRQVMEALRQQGQAVAPSPPAAAAPATVPDTSRAKRPAAPAGPQKVFLTAQMIEQRIASEAGDGRTVELAHYEFLTPAAQDVADLRHLTVRKAARALPKPQPAGGESCPAESGACSPTPAGRGGSLGLVIDRPDEKVRSVLTALSHDRIAVVDYSQTDCWIENTRLLCGAIASGAVAGGVLILPYAADAMVLANKIRGIRAVQGVRAASVSAAMRHFAPNLLVLEHVFGTYHEMRTMIRTFAAGRPAQPQAKVLMETLSQLEGA